MKKLIENMVGVKLDELKARKSNLLVDIAETSRKLENYNQYLETTNNNIAELEEFLAQKTERVNEQIGDNRENRSSPSKGSKSNGKRSKG